MSVVLCGFFVVVGTIVVVGTVVVVGCPKGVVQGSRDQREPGRLTELRYHVNRSSVVCTQPCCSSFSMAQQSGSDNA